MKIASLFKGTLLALNVLLLLDVLPAAIAQIQALAGNEIPSGDAAWLQWLFIVTSFVALASSFAAFWAVAFCMQRRVCGVVVLVMDLAIKFLAMIAFGVLVGFAIRDAVAGAGTTKIFEAVAKVWSSGVMGFFLCLATVVFELSFLVWRRKSASGEYHELAINSEVWK